MKSFVFISIILMSFNTWAFMDFDGNWAGEGTYVYDGEITNCSVFELSFQASERQFRFNGGQRQCEKHNERFYPTVLAAKEGKLFFNGQEVGSYTENTLELYFEQPEGNGDIRKWRMHMRVSGDHVMYEESRTMNDEKTPLISFAGIMKRL